MVADLVGKTVLVLSDNEGLSRAIELNLERSDLEVIRFASSSPGQWGSQAEVGDFDLIVVAMSSPTSEPVVTLARASLAGLIGQVPLLIISDRPFHSEPDDQITHLDFPYDLDRLHDKVEEILQGNGLESAACPKVEVLNPLMVEKEGKWQKRQDR
jgi:DNA-binding response OmpR family regulator